MEFTLWCVISGLLLILMALAGSVLQRLPLTASLFYLAVGFGLGPTGVGLLRLDPLRQSAFLERVTEGAVLVSLFTAGAQAPAPRGDRRWFPPGAPALSALGTTLGAGAPGRR